MEMVSTIAIADEQRKPEEKIQTPTTFDDNKVVFTPAQLSIEPSGIPKHRDS